VSAAELAEHHRAEVERIERAMLDEPALIEILRPARAVAQAELLDAEQQLATAQRAEPGPLTWEQRVARSNRAAPTNKIKWLAGQGKASETIQVTRQVTMTVRTECANCGRELSTATHDPCPACGSTRQSQIVSLGTGRVSVVGHRPTLRLTREFYERHPVLFPLALALTFGAPFLGLVLAGWAGVLVGLVLSGLCFLAGLRGMTKVRQEIEHE
jgi:hypothetical protein